MSIRLVCTDVDSDENTEHHAERSTPQKRPRASGLTFLELFHTEINVDARRASAEPSGLCTGFVRNLNITRGASPTVKAKVFCF